MSPTDTQPTLRPANSPQRRGIPPKPKPEDFLPPVGWLFGRQLVANLKWILLYTIFKGKLDARDWMEPRVIPAVDSAAEVDKFWRGWNDDWKAEEDGDAKSGKEFWFDYISDTGDGQKAVYSVAYLCLSDFSVGQEPGVGDEPQFVTSPDKERLRSEGKMLLPRGTFLFVGGDTSYHIADYGTLANRFQNPFWWAYDDLRAAGARSVGHEVPRLLFGIPGNHDYYDSLDGFNRQFRRPSGGDDIVEGQRTPQLMLPTFRRKQESSFVALRLPFGWWFWGLDTEQGEIDFRQLQFFKGIQAEHAPRKLIVATPEPNTVFGKFAKPEESQSKTFKELGLERAYLSEPEPLGEGKCRVDLAGDVHHYARYWGPPPASPQAESYTAVMAGGGGAFFHPSHTNVGDVPMQALYPRADVSRREVARQMFKFRNIWKGGWVWLFGFLVAFALAFAANFPQSSRDAFDSFPPWVALNISPGVAEDAPPPVTYVKPLPRYTFAKNQGPTPPQFAFWVLALVASVAALGAALGYSAKLFSKKYDPAGTAPRRVVDLNDRLKIWALVFASFGLLAYGLLGFRSWEEHITRYGRSLIILVALAWAVLAVIESVRYSGWLFEEAYVTNIKAWHYWPIWALLFMSVLEFGASLWFFGGYEAAFLTSDLFHLTILLAVGGGLVYFAFATGGHLKKGFGKAGFLLLGAAHALLQISVPVLLVRKGHLLWAVAATLLAVAAFQYIGRRMAEKQSGWPLAVAWIVFGAVLLAIPFALDATLEPVLRVSKGGLNMPHGGWARLGLCLYAGLIGAVMSCVLFGSYLAVALGFNGHNNEAGGAARIEGFKQFIRFRLTREGLTGYVIAVDEQAAEGGQGKLHPKIVDVFHVREK